MSYKISKWTRQEDLIEKMARHNWEAMDFKERYELIEEFTQDLFDKFGEDGYIAKLGYDIDDCQFIVWRAYEKALETGKVRLGLL